MSALIEKIKSQEWYQQIQTGWEQLRPEQRRIVTWSTIFIGLGGGSFYAYQQHQIVSQLESEFQEKTQLISILDQGNAELQKLRQVTGGINPGGAPDFRGLLQSMASQQNILPESFTFLEDNAPKTHGAVQEIPIKIQIVDVSLRSLIQWLGMVETQPAPLKVRGLKISKNAQSQLISAQISLTAFQPLSAPEKAKP